jgi:hypothetical protein
MSRINTRLIKVEEYLIAPKGPGRIAWMIIGCPGYDEGFAGAALAAMQDAVSPALLALAGTGVLSATIGIDLDGSGAVEAAGRSWHFELKEDGMNDVEAVLVEDYTRPWAVATWARVLA